MKSRYSHVIMLLAAIAAFIPVMAVDYLLDSYVRVRERAHLQQAVDAATGSVQTVVHDAIASLRRILADSPSLCTPTFIANVHKQMEQSLYLKQVLVENADGVQYCDAMGRQIGPWRALRKGGNADRLHGHSRLRGSDTDRAARGGA